MSKRFSLLQLFSIVDGRNLTTKEDDHEIITHLLDTPVLSHNVLIIKECIKSIKPSWFIMLSLKFEELELTKDKTDDECLGIISGINKMITIPHLNKGQKEYLIRLFTDKSVPGMFDYVTAGGVLYHE